MGKKRILAIILALLAFLLCDVILFAVMTQRYPQRVILPEELYGSELENLKEFELGEDGLLTSQSTDPWILFPLEEETNVRQVTIYLSQVSEKGQRVDVFLEPTYCMESVTLENGRISVSFDSALAQGVTGIRLDLTERENDSFRVERVVVNSWTGLALTILSLSLCVLALVAMVVVEILLWRRLLRPGWARSVEGGESRWRRWARLIPAAFQGLCKVAVVVVGLCRYNLLFSDLGDHQRLLYWMLLLGTEGICLGAMILRCTGQRRNLPLCMALIPFWAVAQFAAVELLSISQFNFQSIRYLLLNLLCCCAVAWVLLILLRWGALAITLASGLFAFWALANHYYGMIRGNPLQLSDVAQAGTAANVIGNYSFSVSALVVAVVLAEAAIGVAAFAALGRCRWSWDWRRECCGLAAVVAAVLVFGIGCPAFGAGQDWDIPSVNQQYGYVLSFCAYAKGSAADKKPDDYSPERVESILAAVADDADDQTSSGDEQEDLPNIIVIMNEAFADLPEIYGFETSADPLSNIHSMDNTITGRLLVSVFGGGTSNTEYEFLTGNSLYTLPVGCSPYVQYMSGQQQSIAWYLQGLGYSTAGYHPYAANGYRRSANYPLLGLTPFYSIDDQLPSQEYLRSYLSDSSDFENVIWLYEQRDEDQPFFLFNVTMQNHGSYSTDCSKVEVTVEPELEALQEPQMEEYLSLIHASDQAFKELTDYFSQVEEDTIILMFGDHQPSLSEDISEVLKGLYQEREGYANADNMIYQSSFVIWANFDLEEASDVLTSPNYLRAMVLEQAGVELSVYDRFLLQLQEEFPAMNAFSYLDSDGVWHLRGEDESQALEDYACVVYNNVFDKKNMNEDYYF